MTTNTDLPGLRRRGNPVAVRVQVDLDSGDTWELEIPTGTRPTVEVNHSQPVRDVVYGQHRPIFLAGHTVRLVIEADSRDGTAGDGALCRISVAPTATDEEP